MRNLSLRSALLFGCLVTLFACNDAGVEDAGDPAAGPPAGAPEPVTQANAARLVKGNLVSPAEAERLARDFARASFGRGSAVAIASTSVEADGAGAPALYVFNFKGGGFLVLAADKRQEPVVAFSEEGDFDPQGLRDGQAPEGVRGFVSRTKRYAQDVRAGLAPATSSAAHFERLVGDLEENLIYPPDPNTCTVSPP
jgi:Spi protease inhibitor